MAAEEIVEVAGAAKRWLGLTDKQAGRLLLLIAGGAMSFHVAYACGWLALIGLNGFAKADDLKDLKHVTAISATINLAREIRDEVQVRCKADQRFQQSLTDGIERLQGEYYSLTGQRYPEPPCN